MDPKTPWPTGPISWMARNRVAANLMMAIFILGGLLLGARVKQEVFPEFELDVITISVSYPAASPSEVEQGVILAIEDKVRGLDGIKKVTSVSLEGTGTVSVELLSGVDGNQVLQDVTNTVDSILSLPEEAERPIVSLVQAKRQVISLMIYGDQKESTLRGIAEMIRDELLQEEGITLVELSGVRNLEIGVEVPQSTLREYGLTLGNIASLIRNTALELPGGGVKTSSGEVLLRTQERRDYGREFATIPIIAQEDGTQVPLSALAQIRDGFEDTDKEAFFNGKRAVRLDVYRVGSQTPLSVSQNTRNYLKRVQSRLPEGISIATWNDRSEIYGDRIFLLLKNACLGLILVLILLGLFLEPHLAFWVTMGIPTSIIGSFLLLPLTGASINMVSLFAFIVTLGIIVDDAVVVGEIIYQKRERGMGALRAAIEGAREISVPVCFAVLTNIAAFTPLFFVPGSSGKIFWQIPAVTVAVFIISLVESLYVLPSHLSHRHPPNRFLTLLSYPRQHVNHWLRLFVHKVYTPFLCSAMQWRYFTLAAGLSVLLVFVGLVLGGRVTFAYLPRVDSDLVTVQAVLPFGVPMEQSRDVQKRLVQAAQRVIEKQGGNISKGIYTQIGEAFREQGPDSGRFRGGGGSHIVGAQIFLVPSYERTLSGVEFANAWREELGPLPGLESISFDAVIATAGGPPLAIDLTHRSTETLEKVARELASALRKYTGVSDIDNGVSLGKEQLSFRIKPQGRALGLTSRELANQVRESFYGAEALRQQRGRNEVKVLVRLPEEDRKRLFTLEELILRTPQGGEILLREAAEIEKGRSYTEIQRAEGRRKVTVSGDVNERIANANQILDEVLQNDLPQLLQRYPGLSYSLEGEQREQRESLEALKVGFGFTMLILFALLAIPFKSYIQPLIVMTSIPFGIVGALLGHWLLGYELSIISMFGIIALSGVVVNDSLVLVVTANRRRERIQTSAVKALIFAGMRRFRPIILTSFTTFFGLAPMIFETSMQARFLIPMAISLGFGILFSTAIILIIVPCSYLIVEDLTAKETPSS